MARIHAVDELSAGHPAWGRECFADRPLVCRGLAKTWPAYTRWTDEFLLEAVGDAQVPVTRLASEAGTPTQWRGHVAFRDVLGTLLRNASADSPVYLGEWGIFLDRPELWDDIRLPAFFARDWLAALPASWKLGIDYRANARWGSPGSRTELHCDTYFAMAWIAVLRGSKRVILFPRESVVGWDAREGSLAGRMHSRRIGGMNEPVFRALAAASPATEAAQLPVSDVWIGELRQCDFFYIPSGWYHAVINTAETFSVGGFLVNARNAGALTTYFRTIGDSDALRLTGWLFSDQGARRWTRTRLGQRILSHPMVARLAGSVLGDPN